MSFPSVVVRNNQEYEDDSSSRRFSFLMMKRSSWIRHHNKDVPSFSSRKQNRTKSGDDTTTDPHDNDIVKKQSNIPALLSSKSSSSSTSSPMGLFLFCFMVVLFTSGINYGWPSLRNQLLLEENSTLSEITMSAIFTASSWSALGSNVLFGILRDRYFGTKYTCCLILLCVGIGSIGIAVASPNNSTLLATSMFIVGMGTSHSVVLFPVAGLFPRKQQGLITTLLNGALQAAGGIVFLSLTSRTTNRRLSFLCYSGLVGMLLLSAYFILPRCNFDTTNNNNSTIEVAEEKNVEHSTMILTNQQQDGAEEEQDCHAAAGPMISRPTSDDEDVAYNNDDDEEEEREDSEMNQTSSSSSTPTAAVKTITTTSTTATPTGTSLRQQICNIEYILLVMWFAPILVFAQYYIASLGYHLERFGDGDGTYSDLFSIFYALSALSSPMVGKFIDMFGLGTSQLMGVIFTSTPLLLFSLSSLSTITIPLSVHAGIGMTFYVIGRIVVFSSFMTNIGIRFGYRHYGTLCGLGFLCSGIASTIQYPLMMSLSSATNNEEEEGEEEGEEEDRSMMILIVNLAAAMIMILLSASYGIWLHRRRLQT